MKQVVEVEIKEFAIPSHWHTAKECREMAESWENEEIQNCMETVLTGLWQVARKGGTSTTHPIRTGRPPHFYTTFKEKMQALGYTVEAPADPAGTYHDSRYWTFKW